ncbi:MAG: SUMF1/EgtB/PvdO family nonheme iron enzyme [Elainellaceae cyanobacterium]
MSKKLALLIGSSEYGEGLKPLKAPLKDIAALEHVLCNPELGQFDQVNVLANPNPQVMREAIEELFFTAKRDDLVLLFFSGHGLKDDRNRLHFATQLTRKSAKGTLVKSTAVPASFLQDQMGESRSRRQIVILDCCFSGAFAEGMTAKDDGDIDLRQLGGQGRVVLTSSTATQYAFEQDDSDLSIYTHYLVDGIETGAADADADGYTAIDELHDYACRKLRESASTMQPKIYAFDQGFKIRLAKAPVGDPKRRYRKEVEALASRGGLSVVGQYMLNELRDSLGLSAADADAIEEEVLRPQRDYEKKRQTYRQAVQEAHAQEQPISNRTRKELQQLRILLGLRDEAEAATHDPPMQRIAYSSAIATPARFSLFGAGKLALQLQWRSRSTHGLSEMLGNGESLMMLQIPAGSFTMGSSAAEKGHWDTEGPEHSVRLGSFLMGQSAVTQAQWRSVAAYPKVAVDLTAQPASNEGGDRPVEQVSWPETIEFCQRLSRHTGRHYRLPSEAEWEYACRAGTVTPFHFGSALTPELARCTFGGQPAPQGTSAVGQCPANAFGLYDMHGNVWEWCADHWHERYYGAPQDGSAWDKTVAKDGSGQNGSTSNGSKDLQASGPDQRRVIRGGSWLDAPETCRAASRIWRAPDARSSDLGFRIVCELPNNV